MSIHRQADDSHDFDREFNHDRDFQPKSKKTVTVAGFILLFMVIISFFLSQILVDKRQQQLVENLTERQAVVTDSRASLFNQWLESVRKQGNRIIENELFRLFAQEVDLAGGDLTNVFPGIENGDSDISLFDQLPFMERVLTDFTHNSDFTASYLFGRSGVAYLVSSGAPELGKAQATLAKKVIESGVAKFSPLREDDSGLVMDLVLPVLPPQPIENLDAAMAAMLLTLHVGPEVTDFLARKPLDQKAEEFLIIQRRQGQYLSLSAKGGPHFKPLQALNKKTDSSEIFQFQLKTSLIGDRQVYRTGAVIVPDMLWVVLEKDRDIAEQELNNFRAVVITLAILIILIVFALFFAFWWRLNGEHHAAMHQQFRDLATRINQQKQLLDKINGTIADFIGLKGSDGIYQYVNPAFAKGVLRPLDQLIGMDDSSIFGAGTAARMAASDQKTLATGAAVTTNERIFINNKEHHFQISKVPFLDDKKEISGLVSVFRDMTDVIEEQKKKERAIRQTVTALIRAVELRDPYLGGHSRRVSRFAIMVAIHMQLSNEEVSTLEIAANLSQIGKLAIPRHILNKPERLTPAEVAEVQRHPKHAENLLRGIEFELPVLETIMQMHERLDGEGYPKGLSGDKITMTARILGVCDVFCARIEPRSYRAGKHKEEALEILEANGHRYDPLVISALREVAYSLAGEKLIAAIQD